MNKHYYHALCFILTLFVIPSIQAQDINPALHPHLTGYWQFQDTNNLTKSTVGNDLLLVGTHQSVPGAYYGDRGVKIDTGSFYRSYHNIAPNGNGTRVNRYTLLFDFMVDNINNWTTFYQTDTTNSNDGEFFIKAITESNPGTFGTAQLTYSSHVLSTNVWYRMVLSVCNDSFYRVYINGNLVHTCKPDIKDDRYALFDNILFFGDNNREDGPINVSSVAIFDTCYTPVQVASLGTIEPCIAFPIDIELGSDTVICGNQTVNKSLNPAYSYRWSTGDTTADVTFSLSTRGVFNKIVWAEATDVYGCTKSDTFKLQIKDFPKPNLGIDTTLCLDSGLTYKLSAGLPAGHTYEWRNLPSSTIISTANRIEVSSSGQYAVVMTSDLGCAGYDTVKVVIYQNPKKPTVVANALKLCEGDTFVLTGTPGFTNYTWSNGQGGQILKTIIPGTYNLFVTSNDGCSSPISNSVSLSVFPKPEQPEIVAFPGSDFCAGDSISLSPTMQFNIKSVEWNDGFDEAIRYVYQSGSFKYRFIDGNDCVSDWSNEIITNVLTRPSNPVVSSPGGQHFCDGDTAFLHCQSSADSILWSNGKADSVIAIFESGVYFVQTMNYNGCPSNLNDTVEIVFHPIPDAPLFLISNDKDSISSLSVNELYEWKVDGATFSGSQRTIGFAYTTLYSLRVSNNYCWSEWSDTLVEAPQQGGVFNPSLTTLTIFPNPAADNIKLILPANLQVQKGELKIYAVDGKMIFHIEDVRTSSEISITTLPQGTYTIILSTDFGNYHGRFIKL